MKTVRKKNSTKNGEKVKVAFSQKVLMNINKAWLLNVLWDLQWDHGKEKGD